MTNVYILSMFFIIFPYVLTLLRRYLDGPLIMHVASFMAIPILQVNCGYLD